MEYNEVMNILDELGSKKYNLDLRAVKELLEKLGNPHPKLKAIHVAGTNGKGSVCSMISSIVQTGYKVGMYTSPHLKKINERFKINFIDISDEDFVKYFERVYAHCKEHTYFEVMTALAFLYFYDKKVDYLILEVGVGGRLDATNVVDPLVSVITNISLEHQDYLGDTIEKIAFEKAGIIKERRPVVTGCTGEALDVIKKVADEKGSKVVMVEDYGRDNGFFHVNGHKELKIDLKGEFQLKNAATAVTVIDAIMNEVKVSEDSIKLGLSRAVWPRRFEFIEENVLVDCAHNPAGMEVLKDEILNIKKDKKIVSVVGILNDKNKEAMVKEACEFSDYVIFCKPNSYRASDPAELASYCSVDSEVVENVKEAVSKAKTLGDLVVVCGSIYTVGEV